MPAETLRSALSYEPEEGEVLIASYPKCGTTWLQHIVLNIFFSGESTPEELEDVRKSSYLEFIGAEGARKLRRPAAIKTHLPFSKLPYSEKVKYIYVARNPYDCCVSYYHHFRTRPWHHFAEGTFEEHLDMFVEGKVDYGDYFDHLLPWYELRHASNVLFITYEELKKDTAAWVLRIADFLGKQEYGGRLRAHPRYLEMVLNAISFESMKKLTFSLESPTDQSCRKEDGGIEESSEVFPKLKGKMSSSQKLDGGPRLGDLLWKGVVGDWKNHFSPQQIARMKAWIECKTGSSDVMDLWKDLQLP
ncbi:hypothetical protein V5799_008511 [Amblyomma americanum]|uniref:Sulfotransferase domain-containing protein n=1 Tax=Amblyomma americanum TaxID=6943 RepID=A0AAQ4FCW2_AMBAM